jgi:septin family protein
MSKADCMTIWELVEQLHLIRMRLTEANIHCFDFQESGIPEDWLDEPFDMNTFTRLGMVMAGNDLVLPHTPDLLVRRPMVCNVFAVISNERQYIWGTATGSDHDERHSDTQRLLKVLFSYLGLLAQKTDEIHDKWRMAQSLHHRRLVMFSFVLLVTVAFGVVITILLIIYSSSQVLELLEKHMCQPTRIVQVQLGTLAIFRTY